MRNLIKKGHRKKRKKNFQNFPYRKIFLVSILFLLISISACSKRKAAEKKLDDIRTGTQGIVMNFLPNAPPDKVYAGYGADTTFDIVLELRNKGAFPQPNERNDGVVVISGYDPNIIGIYLSQSESQLENQFNYQNINNKALEGKSTINPNGGLDLVTFKARVNVANLRVEKYEPTLLATACYFYKTTAGPAVCIDPDPYTTVNLKKVCQIQSVSLSNQGAPIAVTRIDEEATAGKTQFKITIKNVGGGDVFKKNVLNKCTNIGREDINKVFVEGVIVGKNVLRCRPFIDASGEDSGGTSGYIRLINGEGFIMCDLPKATYKESNTAYTSPMTIQLSYNYRNTAEKKIQIKKEITGSGEGTSDSRKADTTYADALIYEYS